MRLKCNNNNKTEKKCQRNQQKKKKNTKQIGTTANQTNKQKNSRRLANAEQEHWFIFEWAGPYNYNFVTAV